MKASEILPEAFDTTAEIEWVEDDSFMKKGYFVIGDHTFSIEIYKIDEPNLWGVVYGNVKDGFIKFKPTGESGTNASKVLGVVVSELVDFIKRNTPDALVFSGAKGHGLHRLYELMLRNLSAKVDAVGYFVENGVEGDSSKFALVNKKFSQYSEIGNQDESK